MTAPFPGLAPTPRRRRPDLPPPKAQPTAFLIETAGEAPHIITLRHGLAAALAQLAHSGAAGIRGGDTTITASMTRLRALGVPIQATREPKAGLGGVSVARYCLADCTIQQVRVVP